MLTNPSWLVTANISDDWCHAHDKLGSWDTRKKSLVWDFCHTKKQERAQTTFVFTSVCIKPVLVDAIQVDDTLIACQQYLITVWTHRTCSGIVSISIATSASQKHLQKLMADGMFRVWIFSMSGTLNTDTVWSLLQTVMRTWSWCCDKHIELFMPRPAVLISYHPVDRSLIINMPVCPPKAKKPHLQYTLVSVPAWWHLLWYWAYFVWTDVGVNGKLSWQQLSTPDFVSYCHDNH